MEIGIENNDVDTVDIDRGETGVRILYSLLFWLVLGLIRVGLGLLIAFELFWTLITTERPAARVRIFGNRLVSYSYRIGRYLTYNEDRPPFPFEEFPPEVEPTELDPDEEDAD